MSHTPIAPLGGPSPAGETFKIYSQSSLVKFLSKAVQPPSQVYVDTSDVLQVGCASSQQNEVVTISYRLLRADGQLIKGQFQLFPPSNRAIVVKQEPLAEGFLLSVSCKAAVATTRGQTFVRVFLTDPALGGGQPSYMLMADYVTTAMAPAHPNGRVLAPSEGPGNVYGVSADSEALGAEWLLTLPPNTRWRILSGFATFNASAVAGNRNLGLLAQSGGNNIFFAAGQSNIAALASVFVGYSGTTNSPISATFSAWCPLPPEIILLGGNKIQSFTPGLQGGDQYGLVFLLIEEWLNNV